MDLDEIAMTRLGMAMARPMVGGCSEAAFGVVYQEDPVNNPRH